MVTGLRLTIILRKLQKNRIHNSNILLNTISLSIQFSSDGFSFCIANSSTKEIVTFTKYLFEESIVAPELLLSKVLQIFNEDKDLQQDFNSVLVIHQNSLATIVPDEYFDEKKLKIYLNYTVKTLADDYIAFDTLQSVNANTVYVPFVNINNYLFQNFGEFEFKHHSTILIDKLIAYAKGNGNIQFFVNVSKNMMDIVVINNNNLILYNTFLYTTKEDFIYYILFVAEQLQIKPDTFNLVFLGDISKNSDIYKITHNYVRLINFIQPSCNFFVNSDDFLNHSNYILV